MKAKRRADGDLPPHPQAAVRPTPGAERMRGAIIQENSGVRIFSEKSSNFVQESAQKCTPFSVASMYFLVEYTRNRGLSKEHNKMLIVKHLESFEKVFKKDLLQVLPTL